MTPLTVGQLRQITQDLPDEALVLPSWAPGRTPTDDEPGVEIVGVEVTTDCTVTRPYLGIQVGLFYLDEQPDEEDE